MVCVCVCLLVCVGVRVVCVLNVCGDDVVLVRWLAVVVVGVVVGVVEFVLVLASVCIMLVGLSDGLFVFVFVYAANLFIFAAVFCAVTVVCPVAVARRNTRHVRHKVSL